MLGLRGGPVEDGGVVGEREAVFIVWSRGRLLVSFFVLVRWCGEFHQGHEGCGSGVGRGSVFFFLEGGGDETGAECAGAGDAAAPAAY